MTSTRRISLLLTLDLAGLHPQAHVTAMIFYCACDVTITYYKIVRLLLLTIIVSNKNCTISIIGNILINSQNWLIVHSMTKTCETRGTVVLNSGVAKRHAWQGP